jgi:hypothetical protein
MNNSIKWADQYKIDNKITFNDYELLHKITKKINRAKDDEICIEHLCDGKNDDILTHYTDSLLDQVEVNNIDIDYVEQFWVEQVREYFRNQPFTLSADTSRTIAASFDELFEQARKRQKQNPGTQYLGIMLQHLVAAKLSVILPPEKIEIHGVSVADSPTERSGDFVINNTVIHCTTAPGDPLIQKCKLNIRGGCLPVIITIFDRVKNACDLAADVEISGRVEVWDIQQFLSTNINEHGFFDEQLRTAKLTDIIKNYNQIIDTKETDPSLKIEFEAI